LIKYNFFGYRRYCPSVLEICDWCLGVQKNCTVFKLYFDDWFILNYDRISLEELENK
jgi:hypothetical protein